MENASARDSLFDQPLDIWVLNGGLSSEREISLLSGAAVAEALVSCGHRVQRIDLHPLHPEMLDGPAPDVAFIAMHGEFGEDGRVQGLCEQRGLAYVGSGPHSSELAMDKAASKQVYRRVGLDTPDWVVIEEFDTPAKQAELVGRVELPCVLKPVDGGSSVDIFIVRTEADRHEGLEYLLDKYSRALLERYVPGREFTVGILGRRALPVMEIRVGRDFYDYTAKYDDAATEFVADHGLDDAAVDALQRAAVEAHTALGCRDMSRSDFRMDDEGRFWIMETNTIPGFTGHSLLPKSAAVAGIEFPRLCEMLVQMALERRDLLQQRMSGMMDAR